jgi:hypothetical protein
MRNTGGFVREEKASGKEVRETPTTRQGPHGESDGAEESEDGNAVHTGSVPMAKAPSLWQYGVQMLPGSTMEMNQRC